MTENPPKPDPRYDARFQRGYRPPVEDAEQIVEWAAESERRVDARRMPVLRDAVLGDRLASELPPAERTEDAAPIGPAVGIEPETDVTAGRFQPSVASAEPPVTVAGLAGRVIVRWAWLVLAAALVFIVAGAAAVWNISMSRNPFVGTRTEEDLLIETVLQLAPSLVSVGFLGIVAVLSIWALAPSRGARPWGSR